MTHKILFANAKLNQNSLFRVDGLVEQFAGHLFKLVQIKAERILQSGQTWIFYPA